jgi:hypothetical protein
MGGLCSLVAIAEAVLGVSKGGWAPFGGGLRGRSPLKKRGKLILWENLCILFLDLSSFEEWVQHGRKCKDQGTKGPVLNVFSKFAGDGKSGEESCPDKLSFLQTKKSPQVRSAGFCWLKCMHVPNKPLEPIVYAWMQSMHGLLDLPKFLLKFLQKQANLKFTLHDIS